MTLTICSYVSNHAAVPLVAMLIKLMFLPKNPILESHKIVVLTTF